MLHFIFLPEDISRDRKQQGLLKTFFFLLNACISVYQREIKIHGLFFQPCTRAENKSLENPASICYCYAATEIYINRTMRDASEILLVCFSLVFFPLQHKKWHFFIFFYLAEVSETSLYPK